MATPDPDNIYRPIQEVNEEERSKEIKRLILKLKALKSHFTAAYNVLTNLIQLLEVMTTPASTAFLAL